MSGVKGRSGRKRNPRNAMRYFNDLYDLNSFDLVKVTIEKALAGDKELLIYCHDRRLGKPKQAVDVSGGRDLGAGIVVELMALLTSKQKEIEERRGGALVAPVVPLIAPVLATVEVERENE